MASTRHQARIPVTIIEQGSGPTPQAASDLIKETTTQTFVKDVIEEVEASAGADRLLGAVVRALPSAHADHRKGGSCRQRQGQAGQDEHRRASGDSGPDGYPVDSGRDRVRQRPARRRLHGRGAGKPGHGLHRQADRRHAGPGEPNIADILKEAEAVLAEGDPATAASIYAEVLAADATNIAALAGLAKCYVATGAIEQAKQTLAMVPESKRGDAAVKAVQASIDLAEQAEGTRPGNRAGTESRRKPARSSGAIRSCDRAQCPGQARRSDQSAARNRQARPQVE